MRSPARLRCGWPSIPASCRFCHSDALERPTAGANSSGNTTPCRFCTVPLCRAVAYDAVHRQSRGRHAEHINPESQAASRRRCGRAGAIGVWRSVGKHDLAGRRLSRPCRRAPIPGAPCQRRGSIARTGHARGHVHSALHASYGQGCAKRHPRQGANRFFSECFKHGRAPCAAAKPCGNHAAVGASRVIYAKATRADAAVLLANTQGEGFHASRSCLMRWP